MNELKEILLMGKFKDEGAHQERAIGIAKLILGLDPETQMQAIGFYTGKDDLSRWIR